MDERTDEARQLDDEIDRLHREAAAIDPYRYRKRRRMMAAIALGALGAGLVYVVLTAIDAARNPCDRVREYYCGRDAKSLDCTTYADIARESREDESPTARGAIRHQCQTRIERMKIDEGIVVP